MDRGIPTEEILAELRAAGSVVSYLVGTPKGRLTRYEAALAERPWQPALRVKLLPQNGEVYVLAESQARAGKERGMRRRRLKAYWHRLGKLQRKAPPRDALLQKLGAARAEVAAAAVPVLQVSFVKLLNLVRTLWLTLALGGDLLIARQQHALTARFWAQARRRLTHRRRLPRSCPRVVRQSVRG